MLYESVHLTVKQRSLILFQKILCFESELYMNFLFFSSYIQKNNPFFSSNSQDKDGPKTWRIGGHGWQRCQVHLLWNDRFRRNKKSKSILAEGQQTNHD